MERADRTLLCDSLLVQGPGAIFQVGTSTSRFLQKFTLTLKGLPTEDTLMGPKVVGARNGGILEIHRRDRIEWTQPSVNAATGAKSLTMKEPMASAVTSW